MLVDIPAGVKTKVAEDGILAIFDSSRDKWLSAERFRLMFSLTHRDIQGLRYLRTAGEPVSNMTGHRIVRDAIITAVAVQTSSDDSGTFTIKVRRGASVVDLYSISLSGEKGKTESNLNTDLDAADELISLITSGQVDAPVLTVELAWRF